MATLCPITGTRVVYLDCLECEEKICKTGRNTRPAKQPSVKLWGREPKEFSAEETMFRVELTREEFERKYAAGAQKILQALKTTLENYAIGDAERDNSWISYDPYEMAARCAERNIRVLGVCHQPPWTHRSGGVEMDMAVVAEHPDGTRFWCHASSEYLRLVTFSFCDLSE